MEDINKNFNPNAQLYLAEIVKPENEIKFEHVKSNNKEWHFFYSTSQMLSTKELDNIDDKVISKLPSMFYGFNRFYITNPKNNFILEINPLKMMDLCNYNERNSRLFNKEKSENPLMDTIYYYPPDLKVQFYDKWKNIKCDNKDIQKKEPTDDWSFSTPYIGGLNQLKNHKIYQNNISQFNIHFDNLKDKDEAHVKDKDNNISIEITNEEIPLDMLGQDNPIIHYMVINLFDDELDDHGLAQGNFRFRIMNNCFFGLLRNYLRVDNVICKIIDTRIFHKFGENYILREHMVKEGTYEQLSNKGFTFTCDCSLTPQQSDLVYNFLDISFSIKDKIIFN